MAYKEGSEEMTQQKENEALMEALEPFKREERFIVIKRKHLTPFMEAAIRNQLSALEVPTVECVVVESDWPGYDRYQDGKFEAGFLLDRDQEPELREVARFNCSGIAEKVGALMAASLATHPTPLPAEREADGEVVVARIAAIIRNWRAGNAGEDDPEDTARLILAADDNDALYVRRLPARRDVSKYDDMNTHEKAVAMADDCAGDPWELLGYFRSKLEQAEQERDAWKGRAMSSRLSAPAQPVSEQGEGLSVKREIMDRTRNMMGVLADLREAVDLDDESASAVLGYCDDLETAVHNIGAVASCLPAAPQTDAATAAILNMPLPSAAIGSHAGNAGLPMSAAALAKHYEASKRDVVTLVGSEVRQIIGELQHYRAMPLPDGGKLRSERAQIVAWLNNNAPLGFTEAWLEAADAIERGDYLAGDKA